AFTPDACRPTEFFSITRTSSPFRARCSPVEVPCSPPPMTIARVFIATSRGSDLQPGQLGERHRTHRQAHPELPGLIRALVQHARDHLGRGGAAHAALA